MAKVRSTKMGQVVKEGNASARNLRSCILKFPPKHHVFIKRQACLLVNLWIEAIPILTH